MTVEEWLNNSKIGIDIWKKKYCHNNETFDEWINRVGMNNEDFKKEILAKRFIPGGRILSNLDVNDGKVTYSNCYVITPPDDSIESIADSRKKLMRTYSYGGGCGIDISNLSPAGAKVRNQARQTSGAVSFMPGYSMITEEIGQNGRRGALMISIDCKHPDLPQFIDIKTKDNSVTKANISVKISDDFMNAVECNNNWTMEFTRKETGETIKKTMPAKELFDKLCQNNWDWAEPGILFWDRIENWNLLSEDDNFHYAGTNPCAEEPLPAGGSCLLGSLNLAEFVKDGNFDFETFKNTIVTAVCYLNIVLDKGLPLHPLKEQRDTVKDWRQIGLGIMGLADMLIKLKIAYGSEDSLKLCDTIGRVLAETAIATSATLAKQNGSYPQYSNKVLESKFFEQNTTSPEIKKLVKENGLHNSQLLTIAPTGTLSTMLGISGGIEPIFANSYTRKTESLHGHDQYYKVYTPIVEEYMKSNNIDDESKLPDYFITSSDISPENRISMQGIWQMHIDASISSTVNLPNSATVDDVKKIYTLAWKNGLKGVTVYRAGCKREGVLVEKKPKEEPKNNLMPARGDIISADDNVIGLKRKLQTGCGSLHVQAFFDPITGLLQETYFSKGSTGGCNNFMIGLSRTISLLARAGVSIEDIVDQLNSTGVCPSYATRKATKGDTSPGSCCPMAIGKALLDMSHTMSDWIESHEDTMAIAKEDKPKRKVKINKCPQCGEELVQEGGCIICKNCGWSKCE